MVGGMNPCGIPWAPNPGYSSDGVALPFTNTPPESEASVETISLLRTKDQKNEKEGLKSASTGQVHGSIRSYHTLSQ